MHGRDIDNAAPVIFLHDGQCQASSMKCGTQIDGYDGIPAFNWEIFNLGDMLYASVVDQDIDSTKLFSGLAHHLRNLSRLRHISAAVPCAYAILLSSIFLKLINSCSIAKAVKQNMSTLSSKSLSNAQTYARG